MMNETNSAPNTADAPTNSSVLDSQPWRRKALLALIVLIGAHLRLRFLGVKSLWLDEGVSAEIARLRWSQFFQVLWHREANMAFYYVLLHYWMKFGSSEAFIRGLSVIFAVATLPLIYALGRRLFGTNVGLIAAWLVAINGYHVAYSQEARSYALVVFLVTLSTWLLVRNLQEPSAARWFAYAIVSALAIYSHFFAALAIIAQAASFARLRGTPWPWRDYARSLRWIVYMTLPLAIAAGRIGGAPVDWIPHASPRIVFNFFSEISGAGGSWLFAFDAVAVAITIVAKWRAWRASRARETVAARSRSFGWSYALILSWLFVPVVLTIAASLFHPFFVSRYLIICLPALMLAVAAGIALVRPRVLGFLLAAAISVFAFAATRSYLHHPHDAYREDWRASTAYVLDHAQPGDAIFFTPLGRLPYEYYRSRRDPVPTGPQPLYAPGGEALIYQDFMVTPLGEVLRDARPAPPRVWIVAAWSRLPNGEFDQTAQIINAVYCKSRHLVDQQDFQNITVELCAAGAGTPTK